MLLAVLLLACATHHERLGNAARAAGDPQTAIAEYSLALGESPIMDFEYERIKRKRLALLGGEWGPRVDALVDPERAIDAAYLGALLEVRADAAAALAPRELVSAVDAEIARASVAEALATSDPSTLAALFDRARDVAGPETAAAVDGALRAVLQRPPAPPTDGLAELRRLLALREELRAHDVPVPTDALVAPLLASLADAPFSPAAAEGARARLEELLALHDRAERLAAPAPAFALLARAEAEASEQVVAGFAADRAAHRFVPVWDALAPLARQVEAGHPLRQHLDAIAREGVAWHTAQAEALPLGYRRWFERALAATLGGPDFAEERAALAEGVVTSLALAVSATAEPACAPLLPALTGAIGGGNRALAASLVVATCPVRASSAAERKEHPYVGERAHSVQVEQQVGTRLETVQVGSHQVQCAQDSSLDGQVWTGLCDVPDYETRQVPIIELVTVEEVEDVTGAVGYEVTTFRHDGQVGGEVDLTWEDGARLTVPFSGEATETAATWAYEVPGRHLGEAPTPYAQALPEGFAPERTALAAARAAGGDVRPQVEAAVRRHRAALARQAGAAALAAGDGAGAGEAFVQSVLLDGEVAEPAASWLAGATGLDADLAERILLGEVRSVTRTTTPLVEVYTPTAPDRSLDARYAATAGLERETSDPSTELYHDGVLPPNEVVDMHLGFVPLAAATDGLASRVAPAVGFDLHYGLFEMLGLRYGLVAHDELGGRLALGMVAVGRTTYPGGEQEQPLALLLDAHYGFYPGIRAHHVGVFAGASAGYLHHLSGDLRVRGFHAELAARIALRLFGTKQLVAEASGLWTPLDLPRRDRLMLSFPLPWTNGIDLKLSAERTVLPARARDASREDFVDLGFVPLDMVGVQVGARL